MIPSSTPLLRSIFYIVILSTSYHGLCIFKKSYYQLINICKSIFIREQTAILLITMSFLWLHCRSIDYPVELEKLRKWIMCRIPGTWHDSSTKNITIEEFCQHRKKRRYLVRAVEQSCQWLLRNHASHWWWILPMTVEQSCQWLLKNRASACWRILPMTVEQSCQCLLKNLANDCWTIVPVTVEQSCQWLLKNYTRNCWRIVPATVEELCQWLLKNCASDCWRIMSVTVEELCQWLLMNYASDCWRIVPVTVDESCLLNSRASCFFLSF